MKKIRAGAFTLIMTMILAGRSYAGWTEPIPVPGINTLATDYYPSITGDGSKMYFISTRENNFDIYVSSRIDGAWNTPVNIGPPINTGAREMCPSISSDGRTLYYVAYNRPGGIGGWDIWFSNWSDSCQCWQEPINAGPNINTWAFEWSPSISHDGTKLYFSSSDPLRPGFIGGFELCVSELGPDGWQPAQILEEINSVGDEVDASIAEDDTTLYYSSEYHNFLPCWRGQTDIFVAYYSNGHWGNLQNLCDPINTRFREQSPFIDGSGDTLYFARRRIPDYDEFDDIYYSVRTTTDIKDEEPEMPKKESIKINVYPNPFNDETRVNIYFSNGDVANMAIYDISGKKIMGQHINLNRGNYNMIWGGKNFYGNSVSSGIYFIKINSDGVSVVEKMLKLR